MQPPASNSHPNLLFSFAAAGTHSFAHSFRLLHSLPCTHSSTRSLPFSLSPTQSFVSTVSRLHRSLHLAYLFVSLLLHKLVVQGRRSIQCLALAFLHRPGHTATTTKPRQHTQTNKQPPHRVVRLFLTPQRSHLSHLSPPYTLLISTHPQHNTVIGISQCLSLHALRTSPGAWPPPKTQKTNRLAVHRGKPDSDRFRNASTAAAIHRSHDTFIRYRNNNTSSHQPSMMSVLLQ